MNCTNCGKELNEDWTLCPFCGTAISKVPKTIEDALSQLVKECGNKIFLEANKDLFERRLSEMPAELGDGIDVVKMLLIKNIPAKLYCAIGAGTEERDRIIQACNLILNEKFGIPPSQSVPMVALISDAMGLTEKLDLAVFKDPRDGKVYKTTRIGDQVWMADDLKYVCPGFDNGVYAGNSSSQFCAVKGWRLPTEADYKKLIAYVKKNAYGAPHFSLMSKDKWTDRNVCPTDEFKFSAQSKNGIAIFWIATTSSNEERKVFVIMNEDCYIRKSSGFCSAAAVRLIKDM